MHPDVDFRADPEAIYRQVVALDDAGFAALMADAESRDRVIDVLVEHMASRLRPEAAKDLDAVLHVKLWDRPGGGYDHRELVIRDGACFVSPEPVGEARLTLKIRPEDLRKVIAGSAGPKRLALRGRLRAIGDLGLGLRLTELFDLSA